jgi:hypothetical protein
MTIKSLFEEEDRIRNLIDNWLFYLTILF